MVSGGDLSVCLPASRGAICLRSGTHHTSSFVSLGINYSTVKRSCKQTKLGLTRTFHREAAGRGVVVGLYPEGVEVEQFRLPPVDVAIDTNRETAVATGPSDSLIHRVHPLMSSRSPSN